LKLIDNLIEALDREDMVKEKEVVEIITIKYIDPVNLLSIIKKIYDYKGEIFVNVELKSMIIKSNQTEIDNITIYWPSGVIDIILDPAINAPIEAIEFILDMMGYNEFVEERAQSNSQYQLYMQKISILKRLSKGLSTVEELIERIDELETVMEGATRNYDIDAVTLSTVHSSKGLEWDNVYMIDLVDGVFGDEEKMESDQKAKEEERRLFYVGMTRARYKLVLHRPSNLMPSIFYTEMEAIVYPKREQVRTEIRKKYVIGEKNSIRDSVVKKKVYLPEKQVEEYIEYEALEVNVIVNHKKYGAGRVLICNLEKIRIGFDDKERVFDYQLVRNKGIVEA
jgi:DNA helicase-2/ATP-dependent DNA helicase PcrA